MTPAAVEAASAFSPTSLPSVVAGASISAVTVSLDKVRAAYNSQEGRNRKGQSAADEGRSGEDGRQLHFEWYF